MTAAPLVFLPDSRIRWLIVSDILTAGVFVIRHRTFNNLAMASTPVAVFVYNLCFPAIAMLLFQSNYFQLALGATPVLAIVWALPTAVPSPSLLSSIRSFLR